MSRRIDVGAQPEETFAMQASPALRELFEQSMREMAAKNAQAILDMCSRDPDAVFIGTAPNEWMVGLAALEPVMRASLEAGMGLTAGDTQVAAYEEGPIGWIASQSKYSLPNGSAITIRATTVCHQEGGQWRIVHTHQSVGVPDDLVMTVAK
jgi:ketosteroid isomerase-like protein